MGQFTAVARVTATWPNIAPGSSGTLVAGVTTITLHVANQHLDAGGNAAIFGRLYWSATPDMASPTQIGSQTAAFDALHGPQTFTFSAAGLSTGVYIAGYIGSNTSGNTNSVDLWLTDDVIYCAYGTKVQASTPLLIELTPALLEFIIGAVTSGWAWPLAGLFIGRLLDVTLLCSQQRPAPVQITGDDMLALANPLDPGPYLAAATKAWSWVQWAAWPQYCDCTGGSPAPVPPPVIIDPGPSNQPAPPLTGFTCDNSDLCSQMNLLQLAVSAISRALSVQGALISIIQRQGVPFGYIPGTIHSALIGQGQFAVADLLGLAVSFDPIPAQYAPIAGDPDTYHQIGKISIGTADGWERSWMPTHSPYLILPISAAVTLVGYTFPSGITATITELRMEPAT